MIGSVDCTVEKDLCAKYEIKGYPTVMLFPVESVGETKYLKHAGPRTIDGFTSFFAANVKKENDL